MAAISVWFKVHLRSSPDLVAGTGGLNIETPVANIGIRGTVGGASCAASGRCDFYAAPEMSAGQVGQPSTLRPQAGGRFDANGQYMGGQIGTVTVGAVPASCDWRRCTATSDVLTGCGSGSTLAALAPI